MGNSVKLVIVMEGDQTPDMTDAESDEDPGNLEPIGDLALLTANVREDMPTDQDFVGVGNAVTYSGKGKGVGKGKSGSSGPPKKRRVGKRVGILPSSTPVNTQDCTDEDQETATQTITVGNKRGYTYYLTYLFDVPPQKTAY